MESELSLHLHRHSSTGKSSSPSLSPSLFFFSRPSPHSLFHQSHNPDIIRQQTFFLKFSKLGSGGMWNYGHFAQSLINHSTLYDPWAASSKPNTPFDQPFYLVLDVAVGGTNGYFTDGIGGKPWADQSPVAPLEFWNARSSWLPTWGNGSERGMTVQSLRMWSLGACGSKQQT